MASAELTVHVRKIVHVIPVGGEEPLHSGCRQCHCQPLFKEDELIVVHHAWDLREKLERQGISTPGNGWVQILEVEVA